jgi:hypothetical protein
MRAVTATSHLLLRSSTRSFYSTINPIVASSTTAPTFTMGKKKPKAEYNTFLDGEKLVDNDGVRTSLNATTENMSPSSITPTADIPPPPTPAPPRHIQDQKNNQPKKPRLTHFLALPLVTPTSHPQLESALARLRTEIENTGVVDGKALRPIGTLHLTIGVMSLGAETLEVRCSAKRHRRRGRREDRRGRVNRDVERSASNANPAPHQHPLRLPTRLDGPCGAVCEKVEGRV